jgi:hypothetical protein
MYRYMCSGLPLSLVVVTSIGTTAAATAITTNTITASSAAAAVAHTSSRRSVLCIYICINSIDVVLNTTTTHILSLFELID